LSKPRKEPDTSAYRAVLSVILDATSLEEAEAIADDPERLVGKGKRSWEVLEIQEARVVDEDDDATP
jgi:hypothetical protein